jgi:hypothetical protein
MFHPLPKSQLGDLQDNNMNATSDLMSERIEQDPVPIGRTREADDSF